MPFDKRKTLQSALSYTQQGKWDKAIAEYQAIVKADPRDLTVCNNLGDLYARVGRTAEAIEQYLKLGELYRTDGLSVKAIAVYKKIAKLDPSRTAAYLACADLYQEQGLVGEAKLQLATVAEHYSRAGDATKLIGIYQRLAQLEPMNSALLAKLAELLVREGRREEAAAEYGRAAQAAQAAGQAADSRRLLEKARETLPDSAETNLSLAELHLRGGLYAEAVEALTKATAAEPANGRAWSLLGEAYAALEQPADAVAALQEAVKLGVPETSLVRPLTRALIQAGRPDEAVALAQKAVEEAAAGEDADGAVALCHDLLAGAPNLAPLHGLLADLLHSLGREEEARSATWGQATAHEASGETQAAVEVYRRLLESDPADAEARERLGVLEAMLQPPAPAAVELPPQEPAPGLSLDAVPLELPAELTAEAPLELPVELTAEAPLELPVELTGEAPPTLTEEPGLLLEFPPPPPEESGPPLELPADAGAAAPPADVPWPALELESAPEAPPAEIPVAGKAALEPPIPMAATPPPSGLEEASGFAPAAGDGSIDFLGEGDAGLGGFVAEQEETDKVAEQLAEAEVYLKYGLAEKARERLQEVVRLAPDNVAAHRKLKAICVDRRQMGEACGEVLIIARLLAARRQHEAAVRELQEGLDLAPDHAELQAALARLQAGGSAPATAVPAEAPPPRTPPSAAGAEAADLEIPEALALADALGPEAPPEPLPQAEAGGETPAEPVGLESVAAPPGEPAGLDLGTSSVLAGEEELPPELRALLEQSEEEPALVVEGLTPDVDQAMADDLAEAEFYLAQGMAEEARTVLQRMEERRAAHPTVEALRAKLAEPAAPAAEEAEVSLPPLPMGEALPGVGPVPAAEEAPAAEAIGGEASLSPSAAVPADRPVSPDGAAPQFTVRDDAETAGVEGFIDLGAELEQELGTEAERPTPAGGPVMDGLLEEFQRGVREHLDEKDYETHYNLGIAYKEMELYEEAVQEFRLAARDPGRALVCADLLGLCFLAVGQPDQAVAEFRGGLEVGGHPREAYHTLRYDLGVAYETKGDLAHALEQYELLLKEDARFRDVRMRVQTLQDRLQRRRVPSVPTAPPAAPPTPRRAADKKISFI